MKPVPFSLSQPLVPGKHLGQGAARRLAAGGPLFVLTGFFSAHQPPAAATPGAGKAALAKEAQTLPGQPAAPELTAESTETRLPGHRPAFLPNLSRHAPLLSALRPGQPAPQPEAPESGEKVSKPSHRTPLSPVAHEMNPLAALPVIPNVKVVPKTVPTAPDKAAVLEGPPATSGQITLAAAVVKAAPSARVVAPPQLSTLLPPQTEKRTESSPPANPTQAPAQAQTQAEPSVAALHPLRRPQLLISFRPTQPKAEPDQQTATPQIEPPAKGLQPPLHANPGLAPSVHGQRPLTLPPINTAPERGAPPLKSAAEHLPQPAPLPVGVQVKLRILPTTQPVALGPLPMARPALQAAVAPAQPWLQGTPAPTPESTPPTMIAPRLTTPMTTLRHPLEVTVASRAAATTAAHTAAAPVVEAAAFAPSRTQPDAAIMHPLATQQSNRAESGGAAVTPLAAIGRWLRERHDTPGSRLATGETVEGMVQLRTAPSDTAAPIQQVQLRDLPATLPALARQLLERLPGANSDANSSQTVSIECRDARYGQMRLVMESQDGVLTIQLREGTSQMRAWLNDSRQELASTLRRLGFEDVNFDFRRHTDSDPRREQPQSRRNPRDPRIPDSFELPPS